MIRGHANDHKEKFEFTIEPFVIRDQGFLLMIDYRGDGRSGGTGAGVWPTVEKAKQIITGSLIVRAKARTYLRSNCNNRSKNKDEIQGGS